MAETLGSLCDKLTIVKLKQWHTDDAQRSASLARQQLQLSAELDDYLAAVRDGRVDPERIRFPSNKVFDVGHRELRTFDGSFGELVGELAHVNCQLWHEQEKVYEAQKNPATQTDAVTVLEQLGALNLERTRCIDGIDELVFSLLSTTKTES